MAFTVPETLPSRDRRVMPGERKVFVALRDHLPEDYLVYYDIPVDGRHPDFIIVGPDLGLVILEVKDWRLDRITAITADEVEVSTFHAWCTRQLKAAGIDVPRPPGRGKQWDSYWVETLPKLMSQAFDSASVPPAGYQAILIDEGQDFADNWYRLLLRALDPEANRLFIALDSSQNIYRRRVTWRSLGIQIVGHTHVLRRNYRNTVPILSTAYHMIRELDAAQADPGEISSALVVPDLALRAGPAPELSCLDSMDGVRLHARDWIMARLQRGIAPTDILIVGYSRPGMKAMATWLSQAGIQACFLPDRWVDGAVGVSTIHSSKGLDAGQVLVLNAHDLDGLEEEEARRLLYIAMTRARDELCVSFARSSRLMDEVARAVQAAGSTA